MKEATGEVSMTVITLAAIAIVGGLVALFWPSIRGTLEGLWGGTASSEAACIQQGGTWNATNKTCIPG